MRIINEYLKESRNNRTAVEIKRRTGTKKNNKPKLNHKKRLRIYYDWLETRVMRYTFTNKLADSNHPA